MATRGSYSVDGRGQMATRGSCSVDGRGQMATRGSCSVDGRGQMALVVFQNKVCERVKELWKNEGMVENWASVKEALCEGTDSALYIGTENRQHPIGFGIVTLC